MTPRAVRGDGATSRCACASASRVHARCFAERGEWKITEIDFVYDDEQNELMEQVDCCVVVACAGSVG
jgi:hypothetical protein